MQSCRDGLCVLYVVRGVLILASIRGGHLYWDCSNADPCTNYLKNYSTLVVCTPYLMHYSSVCESYTRLDGFILIFSF